MFDELGKSTGKWASNKVFGNKHSTPHEIKGNVGQNAGSEHIQKSDAELEADAREKEREYELDKVNRERREKRADELRKKGKVIMPFILENNLIPWILGIGGS